MGLWIWGARTQLFGLFRQTRRQPRHCEIKKPARDAPPRHWTRLLSISPNPLKNSLRRNFSYFCGSNINPWDQTTMYSFLLSWPDGCYVTLFFCLCPPQTHQCQFEPGFQWRRCQTGITIPGSWNGRTQFILFSSTKILVSDTQRSSICLYQIRVIFGFSC